MASRGSNQAPEPSSAPSPAPCKQARWNSLSGALSPPGLLSGGCVPTSSKGGAGRQVFDWARMCGAEGSSAVCLNIWWLVCVIPCLSVRAPPVGVGVCAHPWPALHAAAQRGKPLTLGPRPAGTQLLRFPGRFILLFYGKAWRQPL